MAGYQLEKIEIGFNLSFYLLKNLIQLHYPDKDIQELKNSAITTNSFLIEGLYFQRKTLRNCRGRYCLLYLTTLQMVRFQKI